MGEEEEDYLLRHHSSISLPVEGRRKAKFGWAWLRHLRWACLAALSLTIGVAFVAILGLMSPGEMVSLVRGRGGKGKTMWMVILSMEFTFSY